MSVRRLALLLALWLGAAGAWAQAADDRTLADIEAELDILRADIGSLRRELVQTRTAESGIADPTPLLQRLNTLEEELVRITAEVEELRLEVRRIVEDGTNRIDDLQFRLTELEGGDIAALETPPPLGSGATGEEAVAPPPRTPVTGEIRPRPRTGGAPSETPPVRTAPETGEAPPEPPAEPEPDAPAGPELALNEQAAFDRALAAHEAGDHVRAADLFSEFLQLYPGGPLDHQAAYWRGEALYAQAVYTDAARAFLDAFSGDPNGEKAPEALYRLGASLGRLGQTEEACLTLEEVLRRYPGIEPGLASSVAAERRTLSCP